MWLHYFVPRIGNKLDVYFMGDDFFVQYQMAQENFSWKLFCYISIGKVRVYTHFAYLFATLSCHPWTRVPCLHDDIMTLKRFPHYWPFVPVPPLAKDQWFFFQYEQAVAQIADLLVISRSYDVIVIVRRAGLRWSQQDFEWRWSVPLFKCLTVLEFSFILFDLCLLITFFNFIMNYVPIVTFWIFTYHKIWILSIMFCFIWSYWIIYFLACLEVSWRVVS